MAPLLATGGTRYFYPRSPCGERLTEDDLILDEQTISIHALLAESDPVNFIGSDSCSNFYPRSPCGERLDTGGNDNGNAKISIHALLAESDLSR